MGIVLTDFQGELPGVSNYDLPANAASEAINCEFGGTLRPARFFSATPDTSTAGWPVKVHGQWLNASSPDGILPSPVMDDAVDRVYRISNGELQRARIGDLTWIKAGVDAPQALMAVLSDPVTPPAGEVPVARAYIYTESNILFDEYTNEILEEGPPSPPVTIDNLYSNSVVNIVFSAAVPQGKVFSIYRAANGEYLYVGRMLAGQTSFVDNVPDLLLGEPCPSLGWEPPPLLEGFFMLPYGFFVGWKSNRIYCSEQYLPHAWPSSYTYPVRSRVLRCVPTHNGAIAITDNGNLFLAGSSPSALSVVELPTLSPCVSVATAVDMGDAVVYASITGLTAVSSSGSSDLLDGAVSKTWWASRDWSTAYAYRAADLYVLSVGSERLVFDFKARTVAKASGLPARATFDQEDGSLKTPTGKVYASAFAPSYSWKSKSFEFNNGQTFGWTQCIADAYPVNVVWTVWQDSGTPETVAIEYESNTPKRFPAKRLRKVRAAITTGNAVSKVVLTSNRMELEYVG